MSLGGGYSPPGPSQEEQELMQAQEALYAQQSQYLNEQSLIQEEERIRLMRDESVAAAEGVAALSAYRREGAFGEGSLISSGYGGFARGSRLRPVTGGVERTYTPPTGTPAATSSTTTQPLGVQWSDPKYSLVGAFRKISGNLG